MLKSIFIPIYHIHCTLYIALYILEIEMHWTQKYLAQLYSKESRCSDQTQHSKLRWKYATALKKTKAREYRARQIMRHDFKKNVSRSPFKNRHETVIVPAEYCFCLVWYELCVFLGSWTCTLNIPQLWTAEAKQKNNHRFDICSNKRTFILGKRLNFYTMWASTGIYKITIVCGVTHFYAPDYLRLDQDRK